MVKSELGVVNHELPFFITIHKISIKSSNLKVKGIKKQKMRICPVNLYSRKHELATKVILCSRIKLLRNYPSKLVSSRSTNCCKDLS